MGKLINGINGAFTGKIGTVIGSSWYGEPYTKGPYKKRTENISQKEIGNRQKFALSQSWLKPLLPFVKEGFKNEANRRKSGFIGAKSFLSKNAFEGVPPEIRVNPALMQVSFGDLPLSNDIAVQQIGPDKLKFTWDTAPVEGGSPYDQVMLLAYDIEHKDAYYNITGQFRSTGADILEIDDLKGCTWHLYLAFTADDRKKQSHSVYLGTISN